MWITQAKGAIQILEKKKGKWEIGERCVVVDGEIVGIFGKENRLVVCCKSEEVLFVDVKRN